jgi:hypothetical protein
MTSFAELVDYDAQFTALAKRGIIFSEENKKLFRSICEDELKQFDGNKVIGKNLGASMTNLVYMLFSFIQNIVSGFDSQNIGDSLSAAADTTGEKSKLHMLNEATMRICKRFKAEGGEFANAAELVSGQKLGDTPPEQMDSGIYSQIRKSIALPFGTSSSLNRGRSA